MKVEDITVKVTYEVGLGGLDIPEEAFQELKKAFDNLETIDGFGYDEYNDARDWLFENIMEKDCCRIEYEIEDLNT